MEIRRTFRALSDFAFGSLDDDGSVWPVKKGELFIVEGTTRDNQIETILNYKLAVEVKEEE